jgi:DNA-binding LytR/AlgR family response regulator
MDCIIIDDDILAIKALKKCIERNGSLNLIAEFNSGEDALLYLNKESCDILFLDIEMKGMSGLDLIRKLNNIPFIVIMSAKSEYAAEAFNFDVVDYIVKPVLFDRFEKAISKVEKVAENLKSSGKEFFFIKQDNKMLQMMYKDVTYIEALADYVNIYSGEKRFTILSTMKAVENQLPKKDFMRIHRSYIVRLDKIKEIEDNTISVGGKLLPVSRSNKDSFLKQINLL